MSLLFEVRYAALLTYSPHTSDEVAVRSRRVRGALKGGQPALFERAAAVLQEHPDAEVVRNFLAGNPTLVPVPGSAPRHDPAALWPSRLVCRCLVAAGLGGEVVEYLRRIEAVPKSAYQPKGGRPTAVRHFETMVVERDLREPARIVVVDDVVTKGNTLLAAASRIQEAFPSAEVTAFALLRTLGRIPHLDKIVDPCVGIIRCHDQNADRNP